MTHCHTDHLLGLAHVIRAVKTPITIYMSPALEHKLDALMDVVGMKSRYPKKKES